MRSTEVSFLQQTHFSSKVEQKWKIDFKGHVYFSYKKEYSYGVLTAYFEKKLFLLKNKKLIRLHFNLYMIYSESLI